MRARGLFTAICGLVLLACAGDALARPTYFEVFTERYALTASDRTYACGNCHFLWTGTGARNPFGSAVEQQLYLGKSINQALADLEAQDTDGDGFTNVDEIANYRTLPGYSCANFQDAQGAPSDYHTFITPMVSSCLEPLDIRVAPPSLGFLTEVGQSDTQTLTIFNNGQDFPLNVSAAGIVGGNTATFSATGPAAPFSIPVGQSVTFDVTFTPPSAIFGNATFRITSNDPDEPTVDVSISAFGFIHVVASAPRRAACLKEVDKEFRRYTAKHLKEWSRCYLDEVAGLACDTGRRDLVIGQAEAKLRERIGGSKDRVCGNQSPPLNPSLLGFPNTCGGSCGSIDLNSISSLVDCLICREDEGMADTLRVGLGTAPPDLPPNVAGSSQALACQRRILSAMQKGVADVTKMLGRCELANITASSPVDCSATHADTLAGIRAKVDAQLASCSDTTGLLSCPLEPPNDPVCLGQGTESVGTTLVDATFGLED